MADNITIKNSDSFRKELTDRNIYSIDNEYPITSETTIDKIVKSVSNITKFILPFGGNSISDSLLGRTITEKSKLTEIGLACLSKQLSYTVKDNLLSDYTPKVDVGALLGNGGKFISWTDYTITRKKEKDAKSSIKNFLKAAVGFQNSNTNDLAFQPNDTNIDGKKTYTNYDIIDYTGKDVTGLISTNVSRNPYVNNILAKKLNLKSVDPKYSEYGLDSTVPVVDNAKNPDSTTNFIKDNLENNTNITNDFIWGIDNGKVNATSGLLKHTKDIIDSGLTAYSTIKDGFGKQFIDKDGNISYNGSNIYESSDVALIPNAFGLRQHSFKDPYGKFAKAIRFDGNNVYKGNKNSVIYNSVIPRIHPIGKDPKNKNLMFSIENLADTITSHDTYGEDADHKKIPFSEIGQFGGRMMWFPPYDISFNESTANKIDETMMVGRGEPIYTYMNSSRTGTLSFKLIIDYPQQLKTMLKIKNNNLTQEEISNFFQYGINLDLNKSIDQDKLSQKSIDETNAILKRSTYVDNLQGLSNNSSRYFLKEFDKNNKTNTTYNKLYDLFYPYYNGNMFKSYFNISINISYIINRDGIDITGITNDIIEYLKDLYDDIAYEEYDREIPIIDNYNSEDVKMQSDNPFNKYGDDDYYIVLISRNGEDNVHYKISNEDLETLDKLNPIINPIIYSNDFETNLNEVTASSDGTNSLINNTFRPAFHSQTPEEFHRRLTFLQQCMRQGAGMNLTDNPKNSTFGKQPFSIIRLGDHIFSKVIFSNLTIDYDSKDIIWDLNPEGWGMQPMTANVTLQMFMVGGQSLAGPVEALQNALSYNHYANSTYDKRGFYNDGEPIIKNNTGK